MKTPPHGLHADNSAGMTEASPLVTCTSELDILIGSSGSLLPGFKAKVVDLDGNEVTTHEGRGELLIQSPSVVLGYLNNEKANAETFVHHEDGRWLRSGDEVLVRNSASGNEHFVVVDRIKELIKVKVRGICPYNRNFKLILFAGAPSCTSRAGGTPTSSQLRR